MTTICQLMEPSLLCESLFFQHLMQLEARVTKNMLQTNVPLLKLAAVCVASDNLLLCANDGHRVVYQIQLEQNGVTINGKLQKLIA